MSSKETAISLNKLYRTRKFLIVLAFLIVLLGILFYRFIPLQLEPICKESKWFSGFIYYPQYVAEDDEYEIVVILSNRMNINLSAVKTSIVFSRGIPLSFFSEKGSSVIDFGDFRPNETKTRKLKFSLLEVPKEKEFRIHVKIESGMEIEEDGPFNLAFLAVPRLRWLSFWIFTAIISGLGWIILTIISEKAKEWF